MVLPPALLTSWSGMARPSWPQQSFVALTLALSAGLGALKAAQRIRPAARTPAPPPVAAKADAAPAALTDILDLAPFSSPDDDDPTIEMADDVTEPAHLDPPARAQPRHPLSDVPLDTLGIVELLERLALAIVDWRERHPDEELPAAAGLAVRDVLQSRSVSRPDQLTTHWPATHWPATHWEDEPDAAEPDEDEGDETEPDSDSEEANGYSSLLDMTARHRMIRRETAPHDDAIDDSLDDAYPFTEPDQDRFTHDEATPHPAQARYAP